LFGLESTYATSTTASTAFSTEATDTTSLAASSGATTQGMKHGLHIFNL